MYDEKKKVSKSNNKKTQKKVNSHLINLKREYNMIKEIISGELTALENSSRGKFLEKPGKHPTSSAPFWRKINYHKNKTNSIKSLLYNNSLYHSDGEKANLFAELLQKTFSEEDNNKFDSKFKKSVEDKYTNLNKNAHNHVISLILKQELDDAIKNLKNKTSSGIDYVSNLLIKKLPANFKVLLLNLFNKTLIESKIPANWKKSIITMELYRSGNILILK